ncbi:hypothetical protein FDA09_09195 [Clostridium botulinum]|uniref:hypothetical protein n=1 Tax=Clostridium botulinum TaxID=1491 RepID=UPI000772E6BD|nr:hypothetical protein [Clostridium botulinum]MBN1058781.1 hypothetical protein [Clostridium botulinum]MBN1061951.1 hypothetical protein [Clostridium botulinum]NFG26353.1 hypothetical protein [Clostridium botulinum]NFH80546.1 hypothetical protein [Clostridium botulinum]NFH83515.1 hypothetical protein [Clostridium botulinum]
MFDEENSNKLYIKTIDSIIFKYFNQYKKHNNVTLELAFKKECQDLLINVINFVSKSFEDIKIINKKYFQFIKEESIWSKII